MKAHKIDEMNWHVFKMLETLEKLNLYKIDKYMKIRFYYNRVPRVETLKWALEIK